MPKRALSRGMVIMKHKDRKGALGSAYQGEVHNVQHDSQERADFVTNRRSLARLRLWSNCCVEEALKNTDMRY